jgi:hypothetical protein
VATDYDELRTDVKESQENSLEALKTAKSGGDLLLIPSIPRTTVRRGSLVWKNGWNQRAALIA